MPRLKKPAASGVIFQFKITLAYIKPPIWRRIQVADCALEDLHEHIQTAFGWENCHLHQFTIQKKQYAPEQFELGFGDFEVNDSTRTVLSELLAGHRKGFKFHYIYDFGDDWIHEIALEGTIDADPKMTYPMCVKGARAGPLEDSGGPYGYCHLLEVIADPKHADHDDMMEWAGDFDPEKFDAEATTTAMQRGIRK
jgi:hypothetical protein